ncbi:hypothetical protein TWF730_009397 [Orbilia blumenaviensis]|uniref:F-box domain-containing protein n=1 Tax=Orbilia blumenaviensis TaxID=1796055 RepID=A0AAV9V262_9PEZI
MDSLPTELLLQIFKCKELSPVDLVRCGRTCRRYHDITNSSEFKIDYTFQVDHISHSGWRLIRCLLLNPALGERFQSLQIAWHRRRRRDKTTWTTKWNWTEEELAHISAVLNKWGIDDSGTLYRAIEIGLNSEALIPLLLCFTTTLESLDIGEVAHDMISDEYGHTILDAAQIFSHCMGLSSGSPQPGARDSKGERISRTSRRRPLDPSGTYKVDLSEWYHSGAGHYNPGGRLVEPLRHIPWIYNAFNPKAWPPGLVSLKEFSHGSSNSAALRYRPRSLNTWPNRNLSTVLQLPNLETLKLSHINALMGTPIHTQIKPPHKLKHLEIFHYRFYRTDFEKVAILTGGSLESVKCVLSEENFTPWDMSPEDKIRIITDFFHDNSKETLKKENISVYRSFKGFFDDFRFDANENAAMVEQLNAHYGSLDRECHVCDHPYEDDDDLEFYPY